MEIACPGGSVSPLRIASVVESAKGKCKAKKVESRGPMGGPSPGKVYGAVLDPSGGPMIASPEALPAPRIRGAKVFGVRPGHHFLWRIPATGKRPMTFSAKGLPAGLQLDAKTGQITGKVQSRGHYVVQLSVKNAHGRAERMFRIEVGDEIGLTPPMGWNSWNCWGDLVDASKVRQSAAAIVQKGLRDHGWSYVNIDDGWQGERGGQYGAIQPNEKFGDMKALADYVHGLGLKLGTYSTPWVTSYAGYVGGSSWSADGRWSPPSTYLHRVAGWHVGRHHFDDRDVAQWTDWGIDYLKYDWRANDLKSVRRMHEALKKSDRDIFYSLSNSAPMRNAHEYAKLANAWRTTADIRDVWGRKESRDMFCLSINEIWDAHDAWQAHNGPGHWNDPDMLVVGPVGWGNVRPNQLTRDEQLSHMTLWCMWSAPLLIGCPVDQIDDFTLKMLTNDDVLDVDQDPLGEQAVAVAERGDHIILAKNMEDGTKVVALFNRGAERDVLTVRWSELGLVGPLQVRDLWQKKGLGSYDGSFSAEVNRHGVVLIKLSPG